MKLGYQPEDLSSWTGKWIYLNTLHEYMNKWYRFRKVFELSGEPENAVIKITAETRYWLYVNGEYITRGPAKCYPDRQSYDTVDISKYLKEGKNCIAVINHVFGTSTFQNVWRGRSGILVDGSVKTKSGVKVDISTDSSWKGMSDPARSDEGARFSRHLSNQEIFYAAKDIPDWALFSNNDKRWVPVDVAGPAGVPPWYALEERGMPLLKEEYISFKKDAVFVAGRNDEDWKNNRRLKYIHLNEERKKVKEEKIKALRDLSGNITGLSVSKTGKNSFLGVVLDLGRSTVGCPRIKINSKNGGEIIDIYHSMRGIEDKRFIYNDNEYSEIAPFHRIYTRKGVQEFELKHFYGFRYLMLTFRNVEAELQIENVDLKKIGYPVKETGEFSCNDEMLNKIWKTASWTMQCCMLDSYVDCPDREQGQWMGDALVEEEANFYAFGDRDLMRRMLKQCPQSMLPNGYMYGVFPSEMAFCILPDYNFTWLIACDKYYTYTGEKELLAEIFPAAVKNFEKFEQEANKTKEGLLPNPEGYWLFLDWSPIDKSGLNASYSLWWLLALQSMQRICKAVGKSSSRYAAQEKKLKKILLKTFYNKKKGLWHEAYFPLTGKTAQKSQQANTLAFLAGLPVGKEGMKVIERDFVSAPSDGGIAPGKKMAKRIYDNPSASTYFAQYVLDTLFKSNKADRAVSLIRKGWGNMIKKGYTTYLETWEHTDGSWSVCHAWSAHPLTLLSRYVLGIKIAGENWTAFEFSPVRVKGIDRASGVVPTPHGNITVNWRRDNKGKLKYELDYPEGVKRIK